MALFAKLVTASYRDVSTLSKNRQNQEMWIRFYIETFPHFQEMWTRLNIETFSTFSKKKKKKAKIGVSSIVSVSRCPTDKALTIKRCFHIFKDSVLS